MSWFGFEVVHSDKYRFKSLAGGDAHERIVEILEAEKVEYDDGIVELTLKLAEGDLRKALQLLQSAARLVGATSAPRRPKADDDEDMTDADADEQNRPPPPPKPITADILNEIAGVVPPSVVDNLVTTMMKGATRNYDQLASTVEDIVASGWAATEVLGSLYQRLIYDDTIPSKQKCKILPILSSMDKRLLDGSEESLSILDMVCQIAKILVSK